MRNLITIILILISTISIGQNIDQFSDKKLICQQINTAIEYLKNDKTLKVRKIKLDPFLRDGWNYDSFAPDYISFKLQIPKEEVFTKNSEKINKIYNEITNSNIKSGKILELSCLRKRKKPNAVISKIDTETMLIEVTDKRLGKEGASGKLYLFIFDNSTIKKVLDKGWIE
ncbi:hypothetical protein [Echinicola salinicaeni]|uniref:hypothetical protein n=1 Tax=Echinicola salinicaeni TaxID=2762757 RepID=UPI001644169A|nr:hypothetical protein [Echinicola salinicaeni]